MALTERVSEDGNSVGRADNDDLVGTTVCSRPRFGIMLFH